MAIEKGTTVSALWWQDVGWTSCAGGKEEDADGGRERVIQRDYFIYRKSMRQIARERHHSRKTIRKAIYDPEVPVYTRSKPAPQVAIDPFQEVIRQWQQEDQQRPVNQRHTARRIFQRLREEHGYAGSERTVRRAVSALRSTVPDSHVPQT